MPDQLLAGFIVARPPSASAMANSRWVTDTAAWTRDPLRRHLIFWGIDAVPVVAALGGSPVVQDVQGHLLLEAGSFVPQPRKRCSSPERRGHLAAVVGLDAGYLQDPGH
jgi:hypothetical protein